jgi:uncharacterized protein (DUF2141 family)
MNMPVKSALASLAALVTMVGMPGIAQAEDCAGTSGAGKIRLTLVATAIRSTKGEVVFTLYPDDRKRFLAKGGKLLRVRTAARLSRTTGCFWVAPGHYAVATYHDENGDRDFNRTLFRPKEGFGFSNDAPATMGLPAFSAARFAAPADGRSIFIRTRYPN